MDCVSELRFNGSHNQGAGIQVPHCGSRLLRSRVMPPKASLPHRRTVAAGRQHAHVHVHGSWAVACTCANQWCSQLPLRVASSRRKELKS